MDILEILKQRLTPLYPTMRGPQMDSSQHERIAAQQQGQGSGLAPLIAQGAMMGAGALAGGMSGEQAGALAATPNGPVLEGANAGLDMGIMSKMPQVPMQPGGVNAGLGDLPRAVGGQAGFGETAIPTAPNVTGEGIRPRLAPNAPIQEIIGSPGMQAIHTNPNFNADLARSQLGIPMQGIDELTAISQAAQQGVQYQPQQPMPQVQTLGGFDSNQAVTYPQQPQDAVGQMQPGWSSSTQQPSTPAPPGLAGVDAQSWQNYMGGQTSPAQAPTAQPTTAMPGQAGQPPAAAEPMIKKPLTRRQKIEEDIAAIEGKDYSPPVYRGPNGETSKKPKPGYVLEKEPGKNYDKNHNILDVLKGIGLGALKGAAKGGIPGLIAGGAAGGIGAGVDRNADNKMWDDIQREGLQGELQRENEYEIGTAKRQKAEGEADEAKAKPGRENAKALADIQEKQAKLRLDILKELGEKYYDPKRPDMRAKATLAGLDPDDPKLVFDDRNQVEVDLGEGIGKSKVSAQSVYDTQNRQKTVDVENEQQITIHNSNKQLEIQKQNIANEMKYADDVRQVITKSAEANADAISGNEEAQSANQRVQVAAQAVQVASKAGDQEAVDKARKEFDGAVADYGKAVGKTKGGSKLVAELKRAMPKKPKKLTYTPEKAATIGGGKKVPKGKDPLGLFR